MRLLFVGQAPSKETEGKPPFTGRCGKFLAEVLLGTPQEQMLKDHDFINVLDSWPGKGLRGDRFPMMQAMVAARAKKSLLYGRDVVLLGSNVARAFGMTSFKYLSRYEMRDDVHASEIVVPLMIVVPHPSGINRYWNSPQNRDAASKFLRMLASK